MEINYCNTHQSSTFFPIGIFGNCFVTSCPPPELVMSDEWVDSLEVPSEDELILMDMSAEVLEADFLGELS